MSAILTVQGLEKRFGTMQRRSIARFADRLRCVTPVQTPNPVVVGDRHEIRHPLLALVGSQDATWCESATRWPFGHTDSHPGNAWEVFGPCVHRH